MDRLVGRLRATGDGLVHRIDPGCDCVGESVRIGGFPVALAARAETLWVIAHPERGAARVHRSAGGRIMARIPLPRLPTEGKRRAG
jgi:hypothetical protein